MEKNFSANFQMYNRDGLRIQFTVREDEAAEHLRLLSLTLDRLNQEGYSVSEPDSNAKPKVVPIVAFVRSTSQDSKTASFMPCVHLYTPWGNFKAATVYHEKLADLPFDWQEAKLWDGAAPDRENATKRGVLIPCEEFKIALAPRTDFEGNVKRTDSGNIIYAYDRVVSHKDGQQATQLQETSNHTTAPTKAPPRPSTSPTPQDVPVPQDMDYYEDADRPAEEGVYMMTGWDQLTKLADDNRAADKKAKQPFVWPVDFETLELCAGLANHPDLPRQPHRLIEDIKGADGASKAMSEKQYGFMTSLLDKRYNGGHNAILSALCGRVVNHESPTGFGVKKLIDWLKEPADNAVQLQVLDALVEFLKADIAQFEVA